ncbi:MULTISPECIES: hypothetical protein [Sporolactobacillus]|uniref:hypothetical protein n=1 Tax=Sporolactobacillus TaxID=2077 RepID=UPI0002E58B63|nr:MULTISPECIES: hypothetical protein [Sporolactobacillus]UAK15685.1 hypothetical protein K7399_11725 [Sporolactobacillus terrae]GEB77005.1 hypothetical protein SIN01_13500 [Sporolactobacillus inulinus]
MGIDGDTKEVAALNQGRAATLYEPSLVEKMLKTWNKIVCFLCCSCRRSKIM